MNKNIRVIALLLALALALLVLTGCTGTGVNPASTPEPSAPDDAPTGIHLANGTGYTAAGEIEKAYMASMNRFTAALVESMGEDWTGVVSPLSFAMMLELLANGASEEDSRTILNALLTELGMEATNENAARVITALERSVKAVTGSSSDDIKNQAGSVKVNLLSAILAAKGDTFAETFEHNAADYYNASIGTVDFRDTEAALAEINGWVNENTNGLIPSLFDDIGADTVVALLNALYFNATWEKPFVAYKGNDESFNLFHGANGDSVVTMLRSSGETYSYGEFDGHTVVLVPYAGGEFYMAVILPEESSTPAAALSAVIDRFGECSEASVSLAMPAIELSTKLDALEELLPKLGLEDAANGNMLFPGILNSANVQITQFVHAAVLKVSEAGTEAAAATGVTGTKGIDPSQIVREHNVICNRPYAMAIVHAATGAVLFASAVNDMPGH